MAESMVGSVLQSMGDLVVEETKFLGRVTLQVATLKHELTRLQGYLKDADDRCRSGNDPQAATLVAQIRSAAYEAESLVNAADHVEKRNRLKRGFMGAISRYARLPTDLATLRKIGAEIGCVRRKLGEISASIESLGIVGLGSNNVAIVEDESPQDLSGERPNLEEDVVMVVGFQDDYREIVEKLVGQDQENSTLSVVSIVAVGGAGKTTLARKIWNSTRVTEYFEAIVWVTTSQTLEGIDLLKDIMKQLVEHKEERQMADGMNENDLAMGIKDLLLRKRYLVVLDDLWEASTWEQIYTTLKIFPDATNGSRVILTTQKEVVAYNVQITNYVHALKQLDIEESWELFSSKALPACNKSAIHYVHAFEEMGRDLARKCNGLPQVLAFLGANLSRNLNLQTWSDVLVGWPPSTQKTSQIMWYILACSYKGMPHYHLRSCLLCLAAFPKDNVILVSRLVQLWIVEGFFPHITMHTREETAYKYVTELAERSLVQVLEISAADGRIHMIRICDTVRDWCIEEARQDGFLNINDKTAGQVGASSSSLNTTLSYRSCFQNMSSQTLNATATPNLRTLFGFGLSSVFFDPKLTLLRVIHVEDSSLKNFKKVVDGCTHLRYLQLRRCKDVSIPSSIGKLLYLETIELLGTVLEEVVPNSLWNIPTLRHVYLSDIHPPPPGRSVLQPKELQTLALDLDWAGDQYPYDDMMSFLEQMNQLTSLLLIGRNMPQKMVKVVASMPHLVDMSMHKFFHVYKLPESHHFPQNLRRLCLSAREITEDPLPILEKLPCLVVLVLKGYKGRIMSCSAQGFPELQVLKLAACFWNEEWRIQSGSMPKLSDLKLKGFAYMSELPEALLHTSLSYLELNQMTSISRDDSTLKLLEQRGCKVDDKYARYSCSPA